MFNVPWGTIVSRSTMKSTRLAAIFTALTLLAPLAASGAGLFSDVPDNHPFKGEIESLARLKVVSGNPDGNYYPDRLLNRAEYLKMLYLATDRKPRAVYSSCFPDVQKGSWYEEYVCDAASKENGFVAGYGDGFRPGNPVSRVEALKMTFMLFALNAPEITQADKELIKFVDISTSAWYSRFISAAYANRMLPITGQGGVRFYPDQPLTRGEAAAFIFNAQKVHQQESTEESSSSSSSVSSTTTGAASSSSSSSAPISKAVNFPFSDNAIFVGKNPTSYTFTLYTKTEIWAQVAVTGYYPSEVSCRLYLFDESGFTSEYFLGYPQAGTCTLKISARPGKYQLQIQPVVAGVPYVLTAKSATGDGNDGFNEAVYLKANMPWTAVIESNDLVDWYSFTVEKEMTATIDISSQQKLGCIIYVPSTVDQFGFSGPECGKPYLFEPGDPVLPYYIGISRASGDMAAKLPYTLNILK